MAAKGLPDAVQKAILDATGYDSGSDTVIDKAVKMSRATDEFTKALLKTNDAMARSRGHSEEAARGWERQAIGLDEFSRKMREAAQANELFDAAQAKAVAGTRRMAEGSWDAADALTRLEATQQKVATSAEELHVAHQNVKDSLIDQARSTEYAAVAADRLTVAHQRLNAVYRERYQLAGLLGHDPLATPAYTRDRPGGESGFTVADRAKLERAIRIVDSASKPPVFAPPAPGLTWRERVTSAGIGPAAMALMAASGGEHAGIGAAGLLSVLGLAGALRGTGVARATREAVGGAFGGVTGAAGLDAAGVSRVVSGAVGRWWVPVHWATMLTNEVLATVGPAIVAAGMGGLVGLQGGEQFVPRAGAIFKTAESLGGSLGITAGQAFGVKTATLQNAQDLATGNMFGLAGAATNIMKAGAGGPFVQLGLDTNSMVARFAARLTEDFQTGGLGPKLGNLVTGGAGYLQQIGDVVANVGKTFANVAPNLPGVGGDLLSTLKGGTGALAGLTNMAGGFLGPILSFEAASRWGPPMVGMAARTLGRFGRLPGLGFLGEVGGGGLAGTLGALAPWQIGLAGAGAYLVNKGYTYQTPESQVANQMLNQVNQLGVPAGIPQIIANMQQLAKYPNKDFQGNLWSGSSFGNIGGGLLQADKGVGGGGLGAIWSGLIRATHGVLQFTRGATGGNIGAPGGPLGTFDPTGYEVAQAGINKLAQAFVLSLGTGKQVQNQWKGLTGQSIDMGKAFDVATMAQLQLGSAFEKNGKLSTLAKTMIQNLQTGYQAMNFSGGQFGNAVAAQTTMAGLQHTQLAAVNQAWDQMTQMVQGGALSASGFFGLLGGAPVASTRGRRAGVTLSAAAAGNKAFAQALGSFITPGGAAAWNTLTSPQGGVLPALEGQMNWLRTAQVMGSLTPGQTSSMAGFDIAQLLPRLGHNAAALSMVSAYAQQFGGPAFAPGTSGADMASQLRAWTKANGITGKQYNQLTTRGTVGMSSAGADAQQFVQQVGSGVAGALAQGLAQHGADLQNAFASSIKDKGGKVQFGLPQLEAYGKFMAGAGVPKQGAIDMARYVAQLSGAGPHLQSEITRSLSGLYAKLKVQADTSQAQAAIQHLTHVSQQPKVTVKAEVAAAQAAINAIRGKDVPVSVRAQGIAAVRNAIDSIHGKTVTITINTINRLITQVIGMGTPPGGVAPATFVGSGGFQRITRGQTGMFIPGYGGGDIHPALLESGELVVPKHQVAAGFVDHLRGKIPGFAVGGFVGQQTYGPGAYWGMGSQMALWNPAYYAQLMAAMQASQGGFGMPHMPVGSPGPIAHPLAMMAALGGGGMIHPRHPVHGVSPQREKLIDQLISQLNADLKKSGLLKDFSVKVIDGIATGMKDIKGGTAKIAQNLVNQISKEVQYAKGVAQAAAYGQGFDLTGKGSGIFGSMQLGSPSALTAAQMHASPSGNIKDYNAYVAAYAADQVGGVNAPKSVQQQMKDYLGTVKSFGSDIAKLRKQHLNKDVLAQIIAAGPTQGDQVAQSILGGQGGTKAINQLWAQINKASRKLGSQAAMGEFGGTLAPNLKSGTFVNNNVSISVSAGGGGLEGMTEKELKALIQKIQEALLKQAKKNNKTGIKAHGKSA